MIQHAVDEPIYTTGQVAARLRVSQQTVIRSIDSGLLNGFHVPGSKHRRVSHQALVDFIRVHNLPAPELLGPMRLTLEQTDEEIGIGGVKCTIWTGTTGAGIRVRCAIPIVAAESQADVQHLRREFASHRLEKRLEHH